MAGGKPDRGTPGEVFGAFLKLGLTSFGGPIAHLGYFRDELVTRRAWLSDQAYADLVALCQFLPGPASSQTGFALGLMRAGWAGALAAFVAFTLPSAAIMLAFALTAGAMSGPIGAGVMHGLRLVAVAIVAQAVWGMARSLCPDREAGIAGVRRGRDPRLRAGQGRDGTGDRAGRAGRVGAAVGVGRSCGPACRGAGQPASGDAGIGDLPGASGDLAGCGGRGGTRWRCSTASIAPDPWSSAAGMSCCRCWRRAWSGPAGYRPTSPCRLWRGPGGSTGRFLAAYLGAVLDPGLAGSRARCWRWRHCSCRGS